MPPRPTSVRWRLARAPDLSSPVAGGDALACGDQDFCVKVEVQGLEPSSTYHFGFEAAGDSSPVGRTRTAPAGQVDNLRLGVVSCASWAMGFFNAYGHLAERDVDLVVHLGDYLYEDGRPTKIPGRAHRPPTRLTSLADYRTRHAQYRTDPQLQRLSQQHPVVAVWDDHDIAGNAWCDGSAQHSPVKDGPWPARRAAAVQAYLEWMPVRLPDPDQADRIYRSFGLGDLARLVMLDTRLIARERPAKAGERAVMTLEHGGRSMLGEEQRRWLQEELRASRGRWALIGNQVVMAPLRALSFPPALQRVLPKRIARAGGVNSDQWDGYPAERAALFEFLAAEEILDAVVLSGDLHSSWASELTADPRGPDGVVGVEFVTPSVTASSFAAEVAPPVPFGRALLRRVVAGQNPHVRFFDLERHGYVVLDVEVDRVQADWWHVDTVTQRRRGERLAASWQVRRGTSRLVAADGPLAPRPSFPAPAPDDL